MLQRRSISRILLLSLMIVPSSTFSVLGGSGGQEKPKQDKAPTEHKKARVVDSSEGSPVLWKEPADIGSLDLFFGPGGKEGAPDLTGKFTYVGRDPNGTQKKVYVKDDKDREWTVKFGPEARPETVATRIVWAMGYHTDQDYFVEKVHIDGMPGGEATDVRFKRRHDGLKDVGLWTWENNPFIGTRELDGLKVLMVLMNNWDLKVVNNKVLRPGKESGEDPDERIYYIGDLGATFGKTGSLARQLHLPGDPPAGTKDKPSEYAQQKFVEGVSGGTVRFHYKGKDPSTLKGIRVENAKWMGDMLARLSEKQLSDAFRAGGYGDAEVSILVQAMQQRIKELQDLK